MSALMAGTKQEGIITQQESQRTGIEEAVMVWRAKEGKGMGGTRGEM